MNSYPDTMELIRAAQGGDSEACAQLIEQNSGLIWSIARRFFGRGAEPDDLYQLGCIGLIKAVQGFDDSFGTQFSTYAVPKITGEIRRFLRDDGAVKISRSVKERAMQIKTIRARLLQELGHEPALSDIALESGLTIEEIAAAELAVEPTESLQRETGEDGFTLEGMVGVDSMEENIVEHMALREAVGALPERERMVIMLRFYKGQTQERTARIMGVSQVQVSRIERKAVGMLRRLMSTG